MSKHYFKCLSNGQVFISFINWDGNGNMLTQMYYGPYTEFYQIWDNPGKTDPYRPELPVLVREKEWMDELAFKVLTEYKGWTGRVNGSWGGYYCNVNVLLQQMFAFRRAGYEQGKFWLRVDIGDGKKGYWNPSEREKRLKFTRENKIY